MTLKKQFNTIKENWLIAVLVLVLVFLFTGGIGMLSIMPAATQYSNRVMTDTAKGYAGYSAESSYYPGPSYQQDFAPEVEERKITKNANIRTKVEKNTFYENEQKIKNLIKTSEAFLLNENVNKYGTEKREYMSGSYTVKIDTDKYDAFISQIKDIGELQYFSENTDDITGSYTDLNVELEAEKEKLQRYQSMYNEAKEIEDKITLTDRIASQERTVKYLEKRLENMDSRIEYSTVYINLEEKQSEYANIVFTKFSELVRNLVNSINSLLGLIFWALPWAILIGVITVIYKIKKRK